MKVTARSVSRKIDLRDGCGSLTLSFQNADDINVLTRLYLHFAGVRTDTDTTDAIRWLATPLKPTDTP